MHKEIKVEKTFGKTVLRRKAFQLQHHSASPFPARSDVQNLALDRGNPKAKYLKVQQR